VTAKKEYNGGMQATPGRRERKKQQTRQKIATVAMELFLQRGFDAVTVAEVAEAADVSANTVYNYFPTKEELFFGLHRPMETHLAEIVRQRDKTESLSVFLRRFMLASLERLSPMSSQEETMRYRTIEVVEHSSSLYAYSLRMMQSAEQDLAEVLADEVDAQAKSVVPFLTAHLVLGLYSSIFNEYEKRRLSGQSSEEIHAALTAMVNAGLDLLAHGIEPAVVYE
jgi:AcrR family transcriptional regulator